MYEGDNKELCLQLNQINCLLMQSSYLIPEQLNLPFSIIEEPPSSVIQLSHTQTKNISKQSLLHRTSHQTEDSFSEDKKFLNKSYSTVGSNIHFQNQSYQLNVPMIGHTPSKIQIDSFNNVSLLRSNQEDDDRNFKKIHLEQLPEKPSNQLIQSKDDLFMLRKSKAEKNLSEIEQPTSIVPRFTTSVVIGEQKPKEQKFVKLEGDLTSKVKTGEGFIKNGKDVFVSRKPVEPTEHFIKAEGNIFISKI